MLKIYDLRTDYQINPIGIDSPTPSFSYKLSSTHNNTTQADYQIIISHGDDIVWDSGKCASDQSLYITYEGTALSPKTRYDIRLLITDNHGEKAEQSSFFETGLMNCGGFKASFITHGFKADLEPCAVFFKEFHSDKKVSKARLYISSLGIYKALINGKRINENRFAPGWTSYQKRLQYQTIDVTGLIESQNKIEITVANGWFKGILGFYGQGCHYGNRTALIAQLEITYVDGTFDTVFTDESWMSSTAEIRYSDIYNGETIDYSLPKQEVKSVSILDQPKDILIAQSCEPVKITERIPAKALLTSPKGEKIIDFGQNLSGVVEAKIKAARGTTIKLYHAEALDENGNLFTTNLRTAKACDTFICSGGDDTFLPEFTYHGFRYIRIEGLDEINIDNFTACVMHTDLEKTGAFSCSDDKINRLFQNIDWTLRANFFDIPTDCPQRDERLGYTGDTEIFLPTAVFHRNTALFIRKWLRDVATEQTDEFGVPLSAPDILKTHACMSIWHEAATIVPWILWETYGDISVLTEQYESMKKSVEYTRKLAGEEGLLSTDNSSQFGDWVALDAPKGPFRKVPEGILNPSSDERAGGTDSHLTANVYYLYSIDIIRKTAEILGKTKDYTEYNDLYGDVLEKFRNEFITPSGRIASGTQTAAALILYFDLAPIEVREKIAARLYYDLVKTKKHLYTGFVGTEYIMHVLSRFNMHELAGTILFKEDCPSWLYSVNLGATTIWELWDGVNPDGSFNLFEMNSLNQFGFATVGDWLYKDLCGLNSIEAGFKKFRISPRLVPGITSFELSYESPYGKIRISFFCENGKYIADIEVPANTTALISLPDRAEEEYGSGAYHFEYATDASFEKKKYSEDSTLNELLSNPEAGELFEKEMPYLAGSGFVKTFAGNLSVIEIDLTLPRSMIPQKALDLFRRMIDMLNSKTSSHENRINANSI